MSEVEENHCQFPGCTSESSVARGRHGRACYSHTWSDWWFTGIADADWSVEKAERRFAAAVLACASML